MVLRPFPYPLHLGIDVCQISRIKSILSNKPPKGFNHFIRHLLTYREQDYMRIKFQRDEWNSFRHDDAVEQFVAGRWAAKEACIKAVKPRKVTLLQVEIWPNEFKEPYGIVHDDVVEGPASTEPVHGRKLVVPPHNDVNGQIVRLSISHEAGKIACAIAMAAADPVEDDVGGEAAARIPEWS